jgi:hypothetical protein
MKYLTLVSLLAATSLSACSITLSAPRDTTSASKCAITDVTIVDAEEGGLITGQTVLVVNDRIDKIGPHEKIRILYELK